MRATSHPAVRHAALAAVDRLARP